MRVGARNSFNSKQICPKKIHVLINCDLLILNEKFYRIFQHLTALVVGWLTAWEHE